MSSHQLVIQEERSAMASYILPCLCICLHSSDTRLSLRLGTCKQHPSKLELSYTNQISLFSTFECAMTIRMSPCLTVVYNLMSLPQSHII